MTILFFSWKDLHLQYPLPALAAPIWSPAIPPVKNLFRNPAFYPRNVQNHRKDLMH